MNERMNEGALGAVAQGTVPHGAVRARPPAPPDLHLVPLPVPFLDPRVPPELASLSPAELGTAAAPAAASGSLAPFALLSLGLHVALVAAAGLWGSPDGQASAKGLGDRAQAERLVSVMTPPETLAPEEAEPAEEAEPLPPPPWSETPLEAEALPELEIEVVPEALLPEALEPATEDLPTPLGMRPLETALDLAGRRTRPPVAAAPAPRPPSLPTVAAPAASAPARAGSLLRPRSTPTPTLPEGLVALGEARVGLLLYVREDGGLADVRVEVSSGQAALDEHVRAFVLQRWSFAPLNPPRWVRQAFRVGR